MSGRLKIIESLRWIAVLPGAILTISLAMFPIHWAVMLIHYGGLSSQGAETEKHFGVYRPLFQNMMNNIVFDLRKQDHIEAAPGGIGEFFNQFAQSGIRQLTSLPEWALEFIMAVGCDEAKREIAEKMLDEGASPEAVKQFWEGYRPPPDPTFENQIRRPITNITEAGVRFATRAFPVDPGNQGFFSAQVPRAAGSMVPAVLLLSCPVAIHWLPELLVVLRRLSR